MQAARRILRISLSAVVLSAVLGCAGSAHQESSGEYVDDASITSRVKTAFVQDRSLASAEIEVETVKGTVQLSGFVTDAGDVIHAAQVARGIKGVTAVRNDIRIK
jgi:osmotically-inducible protein OsmY